MLFHLFRPASPSASFKDSQAGEILLASGFFLFLILLQLRRGICRNADAIRTDRGWRTPVKASCSVDMQEATILESQTP